MQILQNDIRGLMFNLSHHPLSAVFVKSLDTKRLEGVNVSFQLAPHDALMPAVSQGGMAMCCHNKSSQKKVICATDMVAIGKVASHPESNLVTVCFHQP